MANNKSGFNYYSVDTDRYQDRKIKRLRKDFGANGLAVYDYLLCEIYRVKGCFLEWDSSTAFDVADYFGLKETLVYEIVNYCGSVGLFNKELLTCEKVLTSLSIQLRYIDWSKKAKRNIISIPDRILINPEESNIIQVESEIIPEESLIIQEVCREVKESKEKESKEEKSIKKKSAAPPPFSPPDVLLVKLFVITKFQASEKAAELLADKFITYYNSVDWMVGKGSKKAKMKSWETSIAVQWKETLDEFITKFPETIKLDPNHPEQIPKGYTKPKLVY